MFLINSLERNMQQLVNQSSLSQELVRPFAIE